MSNNSTLSKKEILTNCGDSYHSPEVMEAMDIFAQQEAVRFDEWKIGRYDLTIYGYRSSFHDGSHGKSHISPKHYTSEELYQLFKQQTT